MEHHSHLSETQSEDPATVKLWSQKGNTLFINLLYEMAQYLGYDYNRVDLEKGAYSPIAHGNRETLQQSIAEGVANIFSGKSPLKVQIENPSSAGEVPTNRTDT